MFEHIEYMNNSERHLFAINDFPNISRVWPQSCLIFEKELNFYKALNFLEDALQESCKLKNKLPAPGIYKRHFALLVAAMQLKEASFFAEVSNQEFKGLFTSLDFEQLKTMQNVFSFWDK